MKILVANFTLPLDLGENIYLNKQKNYYKPFIHFNICGILMKRHTITYSVILKEMETDIEGFGPSYTNEFTTISIFPKFTTLIMEIHGYVGKMVSPLLIHL